MATIKDVEIKYGRGRTPDDLRNRRPSSVEVVLLLTPNEASCLPTQAKLRGLFGPARMYQSQVFGPGGTRGGELAILYRIADEPFGSRSATDIPNLARAHVQRLLARELRRQQGGSGGN